MDEDIRKFIVEFFLFGQGDGLTNCDSLLDKGIIDSTGVLELVAHLEKTYGIKVENDELLPENLDSIDAIVGFLERKKAATNYTN
ncbi:MAG: acyl carrier protein [Acidobacteria bacterium]|nr:acyl carrier protein [Acidobacteriota bacterium]